MIILNVLLVILLKILRLCSLFIPSWLLLLLFCCCFLLLLMCEVVSSYFLWLMSFRNRENEPVRFRSEYQTREKQKEIWESGRKIYINKLIKREWRERGIYLDDYERDNDIWFKGVHWFFDSFFHSFTQSSFEGLIRNFSSFIFKSSFTWRSFLPSLTR